jgi:putative salt-induced outer membrane protein
VFVVRIEELRMKPSRIAAFAAVSALCLPVLALADTPAGAASGWSGSGEFGLANATGNTKSLNVDAKFRLGYEDDTWKDTFFLDANRAKSNVKVPVFVNGVETGTANSYETTANHFDVGGSVGYKFNPRAYLIGAARYDHDDFAPNRWQEVASIGFGYILLKDIRNELSVEAGPGYKRYQPQTYTVVDVTVTPPLVSTVVPPREDEAIGRALINYKLALTDNTSLQETFLAEVGSQNKYYQNDIGLAVAMTKTLALKVAYQNRYNSDIVPGTKHMDSLLSTNLVYNFGGAK